MADVAQQLEECFAIRIREEDAITIVPTTGDVIQGSFILESQWLRHRRGLADKRPNTKT